MKSSASISSGSSSAGVLRPEAPVNRETVIPAGGTGWRKALHARLRLHRRQPAHPAGSGAAVRVQSSPMFNIEMDPRLVNPALELMHNS